MQFSRRNHEHNFHVGVDCYFYSKVHGFHRAKELAIGYHTRVEKEWEELQLVWAKMDAEKAALAREKQLLARLDADNKIVSA